MIDLTRKRYFLIAEKLILFLFFSLLFIFTLYFSGNFQSFLDTTQILLLEINYTIAFILFVLSVIYGSIIILSGAGRRKQLSGRYIFFLITFILSSVIFFTSKFILVWAG